MRGLAFGSGPFVVDYRSTYCVRTMETVVWQSRQQPAPAGRSEQRDLNMTQVKPKMDHSERAARDLLNKKVREGIIDRPNANQIIKTGLPFVRHMIAQWRLEGTSPQWLTDKFQSKLTEAKQQYETAKNPTAQHMARVRIVCAEMYLSVWAGMQADLGQFAAGRKTSTPQIEA